MSREIKTINEAISYSGSSGKVEVKVVYGGGILMFRRYPDADYPDYQYCHKALTHSSLQLGYRTVGLVKLRALPSAVLDSVSFSVL